jgi:hypothetical protein
MARRLKTPVGSVFVCVVVLGCAASEPSPASRERRVALQVDGPRGGELTDAGGLALGYRIFRIHVCNDGAVPFDLAVDLPGGAVPLLPGNDTQLDVFLFPRETSPGKALDVIDFGIPSAKACILARKKEPTSLRATVRPGEEQLVHVGVTFAPSGLGGLARAEMLLDGQRPDPSLFPVGASPAIPATGAANGLCFGIAIDPPRNYALIPCGRIEFVDLPPAGR